MIKKAQAAASGLKTRLRKKKSFIFIIFLENMKHAVFPMLLISILPDKYIRFPECR